jgi:2-amino-4-hydroxy-6-hydroxymethyldihydropteridine diphosphokinase
MKKVFLGLGSNIGDRIKNLDEAVAGIKETVGDIVAYSSVYVAEPWGFESETGFLNRVICVETNLSPSGLLERALIIESRMGRLRKGKKYAPRIIDIDILLYDNLVIEEESLKIPHPLLHQRKFVLIPLCEIAPNLKHPLLKKTISLLLKSCPDRSKVVKFK